MSTANTQGRKRRSADNFRFVKLIMAEISDVPIRKASVFYIWMIITRSARVVLFSVVSVGVFVCLHILFME